jgi:hypothetical protein
MKFYNNIYASAYKTYDKYEKGPRVKAASFVFMHMLGGMSIMIIVVRNIFHLDFTAARKFSFFNPVILLSGFSFLGVLWKYYSVERVENILSEFEIKTIFERKLWGYIAVVTFILQFSLFIYLL